MLEVNNNPKEELTYEKLFARLGIFDILKMLYIEPKDLSKKHIELFRDNIKSFLLKPLFKKIDLNNEDDLAFLKGNLYFKDMIDNTIKNIQDSLFSKEYMLEEYFDGFEPKSKVKFVDIKEYLNEDKATVLFILDDMKKKNLIYDFNGREVSLN